MAHLAWEKEHGTIPRGAWVLLFTGWSARTDAASFLNVKADGPHSPGFHKSTSQLLAKERDVARVGVEARYVRWRSSRTSRRDFAPTALRHVAI